MIKSTEKIHVLIVEDDPFLSNIYQTKFDMEGFKVSTADNGQSGLDDAKKKKPDVILLDILLPSMNGFEILKQLKRDKETKDIPVIVLTNLGSKHVDDDKKLALLLGAEDYLVKTYHQPQEILEKISVYLPT